MRVLKKGESFQRTANVQGNLVTFVHATLNKPSNRVYVLRTAFDFTGVAPATVMRWAGEALLIRWRTAFKAAKGDLDTQDGQTVKVVDMLKPRRRKSEAQVLADVTKQAGRLSKEKLAALIAQLQAAQEGESEEEEEFEEEELEENGDEEE